MGDIEEWAAAQQRVIDLVSGLDEDQASVPVPACPAWTVRDLLSHVVGLDVSVLAGDEPDDHNADWTQNHVEARRGSSVAEIVAEWQATAGPLCEWMQQNNTRPLGDVIIHEQDLRGALHRPGAQDTAGLRTMRGRRLDALGGALDGRPAIALDGGDWQWTSDGSDPADAPTLLRADGFDLTRATMSRRSADQLRRWTVRGDVTPYLDALAGLGPLPDTDLSES